MTKPVPGQAGPGINFHVGKIVDAKPALFDQVKDLCQSFLRAAVLLKSAARFKVKRANAEN